MTTDLDGIDWRAEPFDEGVVKEVRDHSISLDNSSGFVWREDAGPPPRVGDRVRVLGPMGRPFYGFVVNDELVWFLTPEEREQERQQRIVENNRRREQEFAEAEQQLDMDFDALPPAFQARILSLREAGGREWRIHDESYEMFVCVEAVKIACHFQTREEIARWVDLDYAAQRAEWDGFGDGHSGNTFGAACFLAALWCDTGMADRAERLVVQPQAIAPLAGDPRYEQADG